MIQVEREDEVKAFLMGAAIAYAAVGRADIMEVTVAAAVKLFSVTAKEFFKGSEVLDKVLRKSDYKGVLESVSIKEVGEVKEVYLKLYTQEELGGQGYA